MSATITAIAVIGVLAAWHVRNARHPGWRASSEGRFNIYCGYFLVIIAAYWLVSAPTATRNGIHTARQTACELGHAPKITDVPHAAALRAPPPQVAHF